VLIVAAIVNKLSVVEILLQAGADVNERNRGVGVCDGDVWDTTPMDMQYSLCRLTSVHVTSLHFSWFSCVLFCSVLFLCWYFMSIFMSMFIVCESVISLSCYYYQVYTALHFACEYGNTDMALLLISYGADATIKDWVRPVD
jgi:hypothetical protein